jgi:HNH endonuclease
MSKSYISTNLRRQVYDRSKGCCEYCWLPELAVLISHEVDHMIAHKHGRATDVENLALACTSWNKHKGSDLASIDPLDGAIVRLYQPRNDRWREHFRLQAGEILPLTAIGRVTVRLLQLNRPERVAIRLVLEEAEVLKVPE